MSFIFDPSTGQRVYRRLTDRLRAQLALKSIMLWGFEIAGVALLAVGVGLINPAAGIIVVGIYGIIVANNT